MHVFIILALSALTQAALTPPIGYPSGKLELGDGEFGYVKYSSASMLAYYAASSDNATDTCDTVGIWIDYSTSESGKGNFWVSTKASFTEPNNDKIKLPKADGTQISLTNTNLNGQVLFLIDLCEEQDLYIHFKGVCSAPCISTVDFNAGIGFFASTMSGTWVETLQPISNFYADPASADSASNTDPSDFSPEDFYPLPHFWPADHPETQTYENGDFWLNKGEKEYSWGISVKVDWQNSLGDTNLALYTTIQSSTLATLTPFGLCFNWQSADVLDNAAGGQFEPTSLSAHCDFCYPTADCSSVGEEKGNLDVDNAVQSAGSKPTDATYVWVTTYNGAMSTGKDNRHSVCHAWGSPCDPAATTLPSLLAIVGALFFFLF